MRRSSTVNLVSSTTERRVSVNAGMRGCGDAHHTKRNHRVIVDTGEQKAGRRYKKELFLGRVVLLSALLQTPQTAGQQIGWRGMMM